MILSRTVFSDFSIIPLRQSSRSRISRLVSVITTHFPDICLPGLQTGLISRSHSTSMFVGWYLWWQGGVSLSVRHWDRQPQRQLGQPGETEGHGETSWGDVAPPKCGQQNHGNLSESSRNYRTERKACVKYTIYMLYCYTIHLTYMYFWCLMFISISNIYCQL